ncbi:44b15132-45c0-4428-bf1a-3fd7e167b8a9 [Sclerotinia trifoliorum]|uniref:44b15132-45c0-4428-bf1a-3fd7e167b8a9 n=1 Tax=Sclerotinia trifoliorum TaxID=28548 RepID=A0A8H2W6C3_9HELO|nr:44b15132-45c0-4428-bf1a-3fd7e167b8a9 [Sclerotinia trifoliorum]
MKGRSHQHARHARRFELHEDEIAAPIEVRQPNPDPALQTIVSVVYVTAAPTFSGSIAGYSTVGQDDDETTSAEVEKTTSSSIKTTAAKTTSSSSSSQSHTSSAASTLETSASSSTELPSSIVATSSVGTSVALLAATNNTPTSSSATASSASASPTATSAADTSSSGMSTGGKAGLVVGILLLFGALLVLLLFFFRKKKQAAKRERLDDEKSAMEASSARRAEVERAEAARIASQGSAQGGAAHQLSLRPVTEFQPFNEKQGLSQAPAQTGSMLTPIITTQSVGQEQNMNNPFGNHAEAIDTPNTNGPPVIEGLNAGGEIIAASVGTAVALAATASSTTPSAQGAPAPAQVKPVGLARSASKAGNGLRQIDFTTKSNTALSPPSPSGSEFSTVSGNTQAQSATGMAIVAAGGPPNTTVHRVQLDFAPSMDDELELKAGQLIRILHEYDDGWALCIRLDRSKQGVVPRTCLSTRPVKPRPQQAGPQGSPAMRGQQGPPRITNKDGPPYPSSPMGNRTMTPNGPSNGPSSNGPPRPMPSKGPLPNGPPRPMQSNGQGGPPRGPGMKQGPPKSLSPNGPLPNGPPRPMPPNGQGPPRSPGMMQGPPRTMSPAGNRPLTPQGQRPMVPPNHPNQQRSMTPQGPPAPSIIIPQGQTNQQRPVTPTNQQVTPPNEGRARSDSDTDPISRQPSPPITSAVPMDGSSSPPNIRSPVERKPLPGQAL